MLPILCHVCLKFLASFYNVKITNLSLLYKYCYDIKMLHLKPIGSLGNIKSVNKIKLFITKLRIIKKLKEIKKSHKQ